MRDVNTMTAPRAKVLLIAYACRPGESSEREVGWRWANLIQRRHDVTVLTRASHRPHIEAALASQSPDQPAPAFVYYDLPAWASFFKRGERGLFVYYTLWTWFAVNMARRMNTDHRWTLTHFLTFGTLLTPPIAFQMNTPYLLGPVGGGERIPMSLRHAFSRGGQLKIIFRRLAQLALRFHPLFHLNLRRADRIFVRTRETLDLIPARHRDKCELLLETAISPDQFVEKRERVQTEPLQLVSVGRLITSKFNPLMLEVLAQFKQAWGQPFRMTIIGDGPERARLEALRDKLGLTEVEFVGKKPSAEVFEALHQSDIYFSTTMKEGGTWAFFEAIVCRVPVVCLKVNGPDMIVGDGCGIKADTSSDERARKELVDGLLALARDAALRDDYAERAVQHLERGFTWERVMQRVDTAYADLLSDGSART